MPKLLFDSLELLFKGVVAQWYDPLTLHPEQLSGVGSKPRRAPPLECHDKGSALFLRSQRLAMKNVTSPSPGIPYQTKEPFTKLEAKLQLEIHGKF